MGRRPERWNPVDVIVRSTREWHPVWLHRHLVGARLGRRLYVVKVLHARAERGCGEHETYQAP